MALAPFEGIKLGTAALAAAVFEGKLIGVGPFGKGFRVEVRERHTLVGLSDLIEPFPEEWVDLRLAQTADATPRARAKEE